MKGLQPGADIWTIPSPFTPEQIFNRLCRVLEREVLSRENPATKVRIVQDAITQIMHTAPVFYLGMPEVERVSEYCRENPADLAVDPFPLWPFPDMVIANPYNACLLFDAETPAGSTDKDGWGAIEGVVPRWRCKSVMLHQEDDGWCLSVGIIWLGDPHNNMRQIMVPSATLALARTIDGDATRDTNLRTLDVTDPDYAAQLRDVLRQTASMAFDSCRYIDAPRHHLVVEEPRRFNPNERKPKLPRATDRPRVRLVEPEAVRRIYPHQPTGEASGRVITPHARRGHTKVLTSPRYKAAQGKRIVVRPTWVGDPDWEHGATRYRVVFREPKVATDGKGAA